MAQCITREGKPKRIYSTAEEALRQRAKVKNIQKIDLKIYKCKKGHLHLGTKTRFYNDRTIEQFANRIACYMRGKEWGKE